jgi:dolichyl-phosphate-mannose--protein O-mannosyl transferase
VIRIYMKSKDAKKWCRFFLVILLIGIVSILSLFALGVFLEDPPDIIVILFFVCVAFLFIIPGICYTIMYSIYQEAEFNRTGKPAPYEGLFSFLFKK